MEQNDRRGDQSTLRIQNKNKTKAKVGKKHEMLGMAGLCNMASTEVVFRKTTPTSNRKERMPWEYVSVHLFRPYNSGYAAPIHEPYGSEAQHCYLYAPGGKNTHVYKERGWKTEMEGIEETAEVMHPKGQYSRVETSTHVTRIQVKEACDG